MLQRGPFKKPGLSFYAGAVGYRKLLIEIRPLIDRRKTEYGGSREIISACPQGNPEAPS